MNKNLLNKLIILFFLVVISAPLFVMETGIYVSGNEENRVLAPKAPVYDVRGYEAYFNDHFGFRRELVSLCNAWKVAAGNRYISKDVIKGKEGYLFYTSDNQDFDPIATYTGLNLYSDEKLCILRDNLQRLSDRLKEKEMHFLLVIPPNKATVYPEFLPDSVKKFETQTRMDQLFDELKKNSTVDFIDLRPEFEQRKSEFQLYYKTDTHWNEYGAFFAAQKIVSHLGLTETVLKDYTVEKSRTEGKDLARMTALNRILTDDMIKLTPIEGFQARKVSGELDNEMTGVFQKDIDAPKMMIYRDSFSVAMFPFLAEHFSASISDWTFRINLEDIEEFSPDIVILEILERNIPYIENMNLE